MTVIMVEQNARHHCLQICDRAYVLDQGRNAYTGTGRALANDPKVVELYLRDAGQGLSPRVETRRLPGSRGLWSYRVTR
ncbi:MAG: hypothetical protein R2687_01105 [Candidatus Nanopelagicales bacterium]